MEVTPWVVVCVGGTLVNASEFSIDRLVRALTLPSLPVAVDLSLAMEIPLAALRHPDERLTCSVLRPNGLDARDYQMGTTRRAVNGAGTLWLLMSLTRVPFAEVGWHTCVIHSAEDGRALVDTSVLVRLSQGLRA